MTHGQNRVRLGSTGTPFNDSVQPTMPQPQFNRLAAWKAKFLVSLGQGEGAERRAGNLSWHARQNLKALAVEAGLTPIYIWMASGSARVSALCLSGAGRFFALELNRAVPVTVSQAWAFTLACRGWADSREVEDRAAAQRWEEAILKQLQSAEPQAAYAPLQRRT